LTLDPPNDARIITDADNPNVPCTLAISGASDFQLRMFRIIASGYTKIEQPGKLSVILFGRINAPGAEPPSLNYADWTVLGGSPGEPVGGPDDPKSTMWMIMGERMMFYYGSGKLQGEVSSNVADNPVQSWKITPLTGIVKGIDPVLHLAVGAFFVPDSGANVAPLPAIKLVHFQLGSEI
jgi:hypothetical protein